MAGYGDLRLAALDGGGWSWTIFSSYFYY
jgi:hypothetical protein